MAERIEEASLNAWPSLEQILFDGWILRFSRGYTKRANSVNQLCVSALPLQYKVPMCERFYAQRRLPCIFRLTSFAAPAALDMFLGQRGYARIDPTIVMHIELPQTRTDGRLEMEVVELSLDEWVGIFSRLSGTTLENQRDHLEIIKKIPCDRLFAYVQDAGEAVAVGLGVLQNDYFGLFDLVTHSAYRNKGFGTQVVRNMLTWAQNRGARHGYLQVTESNVLAAHVYSRVGFQELYRYWYRVRNT